MKLLLATALLGLGITAAQPAAPRWPTTTCLHGTTVNNSVRSLNLRALDSTVRQLLVEAGATIAAPDCGHALNVLIQAEDLNAQSTRITVHVVISPNEVTWSDVEGKVVSLPCARTVTEVAQAREDFFQSAQRALTRLLAQAPRCSS